MAVQKPKQQQNRKRTVTLEDEVLSLASAPMTKTVRAKKVAAKKPVAKKVTAKKAVKKTTTGTTKKKSTTTATSAKKRSTKTTAAKAVQTKKARTVKKVAAKKPVAKKVTAKKAVKKTASRRTPAKTATVTMKRELLQVETAAKQIVHSPAMHRITRLGELYVLATVVTVFIVVALAWSQAILALGM